MVIASGCCDLTPLYIWSVTAMMCGAVLLLEAGTIAVLLHRTGVAFWRRKLVLAPALGSLGAFVVAQRAMAVYLAWYDPYPSGSTVVSTWETMGAVVFAGTMVLLAVGCIGVLVERPG